jgi:ferredoxin-type protein NapG
MALKQFSRRSLLMAWRRAAEERADEPEAEPEPVVETPEPRAVAKALAPLAPLPPAARELVILRPPGARPGPAFRSTCERSGHCVDACPVKAIALLADGPDAGTPYIDPSKSPCVLCDGLPCTRACPSGALQPLTLRSEVRMGTARIEPERCTAHRGLPCRICYEVCPVPKALTLTKAKNVYVPAVGEPCVGCGICEHHCPAEGAIRVVPPEGG